MLLSLTMFSTACSEKVVSVPTPVAPPSQYYSSDCKETNIALVVNGDLIKKINKLREDLGVCNADRVAIREWAKDIAK